MQRSSRASILDAHVRAAWQEQIAAARRTPGLLPEITRRREELLHRFTAYYIQLRALPRRVRRALQRQWHLPLAGVALMLALGQSPALAATIPVGAPVRWWTPSRRRTPIPRRAGVWPAVGPTRSCCRRAAPRP